MPDLYTVDGGKVSLNLHASQWRAMKSEARFIAVLAGTQGGKTSWGPWWLWNEINRRGSGDYLAVAPTYDLFKLKMLPALLEVFVRRLNLGRYWAQDKIIELRDPQTGEFSAVKSTDPMWGRIILRSAESEGGLESATAKGAWLDEAGQDSFSITAWEAIQRRLTINLGRALISTTIYNFGWLKTDVYDLWAAGDTNYDVIRFDSTENPNFPQEEFDRARASMPEWRFNMQYRGMFTRPAGQIYNCFDRAINTCPRFAIPADWKKTYLGMDFGGVNTAAIFIAEEPFTSRLFAYREYKAGERTAKEHVTALKDAERGIPICVGGSHSEGQWRKEFAAAGLPIREPDIKEVEVGIDRTYGAFKRGELILFNDLTGTIRDIETYSRKLDKSGNPTEDIENKASFHYADAVRYITAYLKRPKNGGEASVGGMLKPVGQPMHGMPGPR